MTPAHATAMAVVYAEGPARAPAGITWPDWVVDRPAPGAAIAAAAPVCTVHAAGESAAAVRRLVNERVSAVLSVLERRDCTETPEEDSAFRDRMKRLQEPTA